VRPVDVRAQSAVPIERPAGAFAAHDGTLYVAVHERGILASADNGATWSTVYVQT